ncbi:MAG TPA: hypothetical protein VLW88_07505 [Hyphomicrobium sp.]|nr:hypothetical protein [Hyphomicrobium sp.]
MPRLSLPALGLLLAVSPAGACGGQSVYLDSAFRTGPTGWGDADAQFQVAGSEATIAPLAGMQSARWDAGLFVGDADACATLTMPASAGDGARTYAGLLFWLTGKDDFYEFVVAANGFFSIARKVKGVLVAAPPVPWTRTEALKLGAGAKNTLELTLEGESLTARINGVEVARLRGQAPEVPSHIGLVAASPPDATNSWALSALKVTNVPAAQGAAPRVADATGAVKPSEACGKGKVLFEDAFTSHDPAWGPKDDRLAIASGEAVLSPAPGTRTLRWNRAFAFDDVDVCATARLTSYTSDPITSYAGLIFWVKDDRNFYQAVLAESGHFTVARVVDGKVQQRRPVAWTDLNVAKTKAKEKNTLRVATKGERVVISVNGKQVARFNGDPPRGPSYVGVLAASSPGKTGDTWSITDFKVTAPQAASDDGDGAPSSRSRRKR